MISATESSRKVLIVDPDSATRREVRTACAQDGYQVLEAESGADDWQSAEVRTGAHHLAEPPKRASFGSPFRYAEQARVFVIRDVERRDPSALSSAYRELFIAAGGGALGSGRAGCVVRPPVTGGSPRVHPGSGSIVGQRGERPVVAP